MASGLDEFELIARYFAPLSRAEPGAFGLLDDAAELAVGAGTRLVVTTDAIVAGVHFPVAEPARAVAQRLLRVNLSDLAAKGARPRAYTLALALPAQTDEAWVAGFAGGLAEDQRLFDVTLIGGDTTRSDGVLMLSLTMFGEISEKKMILRSGAAVGDDVYVSGTIGDAELGLALLQDRLTVADPQVRDALVERFRLPQPRVGVGLGLVGLASAAADVSDGLVADLNHICVASEVSAELELARIPLSAAAQRLVTDDQGLRISLITGGDDYELVFTAPRSASKRLRQLAAASGVDLTQIGRVTDLDGRAPAVAVRDPSGRALEVGDGGYRHFRRQDAR